MRSAGRGAAALADSTPSGSPAGPAPTPAQRLATNRAQQREAALQQRREYAERVRQAMPQAMRERAQWLLWKFIDRPGAAKPPKVPFYASGQLRGWPRGRPSDGKATERQPQVEQGHELDRAALVTLDEAVSAFLRRPDWSGLGFAFLPGDGLIGIDIDHAVDEAGRPSGMCRLLVESCASYTELSPSGRGVHIIVAGDTATFKDDGIGLEVYCHAQYFTCTGLPPAGEGWPGTPAQVYALEPQVLAYMRELVDESRARQQREKAQAAAAASAGPPPTPAPAPRPPVAATAGDSTGGDDFKLINEAAMASLERWVPKLFADARPWRQGYRVSSKALGRELQEDLAIQGDGIVDFGLKDMGDPQQGRRTPIDLVLEWGHRVGVPADKPGHALRWLAQALDMALRTPASPSGHERGRARAAGEGAGPAGHDAPPTDDGAPPPDETDAGGGRRGRKIPRETWELVDALCQRYALVYGTDTAWDRVELMLVRVPALRLAWGKTAINLWLSRPDRVMVRPADLVFEPGQAVQPPGINMYAGLDLEPAACEAGEVQPMLDLLRNLCSETRIDGVADAVAHTMHWVLCWMALPLQRPGIKMASAIVMHGAQGTGKNLFWDAWRDVYGSYGVTVTQSELEDKYNGWISRKLAILGDEVVSRQEMYHNKNRLKLIVTQQEKFAIRGMFQETRWESNHANVAFLSNEAEPLVLEDRDRRYMVIYTPLEAHAGVYQAARAFLSAGGLAKWLHYLLHYPVGEFSAHERTPMTKAKEALIEASWRAPARFGHEWVEGYLDLPMRVCSAEQLYRAFVRWGQWSGERWLPSQAKFSTELNRWARERVRRGDDGQLGQPALTFKMVALRDDSNHRRTVRCWIPAGTGPLPGVTEGEWAATGVKAFEDDLRRFMRSRGASQDDEA